MKMTIGIEKEIINEMDEERIPDLEEIIWGFELGRFDSHNPEYHLSGSRSECEQLKEQYEMFLSDPRRI